jgi:integrase
MHLQRRNGHYWFRKATPVDLLDIVGQAEIRCSLRTTRREVAKRRAGQLQVALEELYGVLRSEKPLEPTKNLLGTFLDELREHVCWIPDGSTTLRRFEEAVAALGTPECTPRHGQQTLVPSREADRVLTGERPRAEANEIAAILMRHAFIISQEKSWPLVDRSFKFASLCKELAAATTSVQLDGRSALEAVRNVIREEFSRASLAAPLSEPPPKFDPTALRGIVATEVRAGVAAAGRDRWSIEPLSEMIEKFLGAQYPSEEGKSNVGSKHRADVERRLAAFLAFAGDLAVRDITRDHLKAYRDILDQLPDRFEARFRTKDMPLAIEKNAERKVPFPIIGPTTIDLKWLGPVDRLFAWLVTEEKIEKNPADGIRSKQETTGAANTKRLPLKPDQIGKLFAITSAKSSKTALHWLPLLMLTTGARPNELAQLRTDDLYEDYNGRAHLSVLCLLDDDDDEADPKVKAEAKNDPRRVKTAAGRRMIPLHPILIKAGFIEFIKSRHKGNAKQLFRELRPDKHGFWSSAITKRINRIIREKLKITNPKYSAYSLRHNFIDACRSAGITEETRMKIVGHQLEGVHGVYGNPNVLPHESELIESVRFDGIDFGLYLGS